MQGLFALKLLRLFDVLFYFAVEYRLFGIILIFHDEIGVRMGILVCSDIFLIELFSNLVFFLIDDFICFSHVFGTSRHAYAHFLFIIYRIPINGKMFIDYSFNRPD